MENTLSSGQWRLGLCRHEWTRSHHHRPSVSSSDGAPSHSKDAVSGWNEEKWCGGTGSAWHLVAGACLRVQVTVSPVSVDFGVCHPPSLTAPWISKSQTTLGVCHKHYHHLLFIVLEVPKPVSSHMVSVKQRLKQWDNSSFSQNLDTLLFGFPWHLEVCQ